MLFFAYFYDFDIRFRNWYILFFILLLFHFHSFPQIFKLNVKCNVVYFFYFFHYSCRCCQHFENVNDEELLQLKHMRHDVSNMRQAQHVEGRSLFDDIWQLRGRHGRQMLPKIQMKIEEKNVCKFRSTCNLNTFSIDENFEKEGGGFCHESQKKKIQITIHRN